MTPEPNRIYVGDCIEVMKAWPDAFIQTCVTSPPYWGLRDYGTPGQFGLEPTPAAYVERMVEVFREVRRVLRDDGTLWLNLGDSYARDPAKGDRSEYLGLHKNINESGCHLASQSRTLGGLKPKDLVGIPWRVAFALQADGWYLRSDIIWAKPNPMPESVTDRPTKAHEYLFLMAKSERYYYDAEAIKEKAIHEGRIVKATGSLAKNGQKGEYGATAAGFTNHDSLVTDRNKRSVWIVPTKPYPEAHFATFPPDLIKPCILAGSKAGDIVFDPFMGAGTTALVAAQYDRRFLGIELNPAYVAMAQARIKNEQAQLKIAI